MIVVGGMIGVGKSSTAKILSEALGSQVFYESVDDNPILPLFYTASPEEIATKRYPFLLQLHFLDSRFRTIKEAYHNQLNIIDRSIYEDWYFTKVNKELDRISELEFQLYEKLLNNMLAEIEGLPKKSPDLMVYLKASFETIMYRIGLRGRSYEQDEALISYYRTLWEGYDEWLYRHYSTSDILIVDMDKMDVVNNPEDAKVLVESVVNKLHKNVN